MDYFLNAPLIDLEKTLLCGQAFRWKKIDEGLYEGVAHNHYLKLSQAEDGAVLHNICEKDIPFWENYFDLQTDYKKVLEQLSQDSIMREAIINRGGIRLLRQEPFETLISFIISQNNNIKRISGIVERLCDEFGEDVVSDEGVYKAFPTAEVLASLEEPMLSPIRAGFRNRYIIDGARKVYYGDVKLYDLYNLSYDGAKAELLKITGVGNKVADCVLLFGFYKMESFPEDVWIKRVLSEFYPKGIPLCFKGYEGIAQQILFDYIRNNSERTEKYAKSNQ